MSTKSSLPFTSVVSYHTNPLTCGVAKFSRLLAEKLGVPFVGVDGQWGAHPLLSLKSSEFHPCAAFQTRHAFSVFWHDSGRGYEGLTRAAAHIFYADPSLGSPGLWCPSLIDTRRPLRLFAFGMGHKIPLERYRELRAALGDRPFQLRVSVGLHEGMTLDEATKNIEPLKAIMGPEHVRFLGCLADESVVEELHQADYAVTFFEHGARMNNTTIHAAIDAGVPIIGNCDEYSSQFVRVNVQSPIAALVRTGYGWTELIAAMENVCANSPSTAAR